MDAQHPGGNSGSSQDIGFVVRIQKRSMATVSGDVLPASRKRSENNLLRLRSQLPALKTQMHRPPYHRLALIKRDERRLDAI